MRPEPVETLLPWQHPFLMMDRMLRWEPHRDIVTIKNVSAGDPVCSGGDLPKSVPSFPTVLLIEGMAQSAALLFRLSYGDTAVDRLPQLGFLKATILTRGVDPGEQVTFHVRAVKMTSRGGVFEGRAEVDGETVAEAELAFSATVGDEGDDGEGDAS